MSLTKGYQSPNVLCHLVSATLVLLKKSKLFEYCKRDVDASEVMFDDRETYVKTKLKLAGYVQPEPLFLP